MIKLGHRVFIRSIKRKGSVEYIDWPRLSLPHMYPVQIKLDRPYGDNDQMMYRTSPIDLKKLKGADKMDDRLSNKPMESISLDDFNRYLRRFDKS